MIRRLKPTSGKDVETPSKTLKHIDIETLKDAIRFDFLAKNEKVNYEI